MRWIRGHLTDGPLVARCHKAAPTALGTVASLGSASGFRSFPAGKGCVIQPASIRAPGLDGSEVRLGLACAGLSSALSTWGSKGAVDWLLQVPGWSGRQLIGFETRAAA
jgi:hypothetical protein